MPVICPTCQINRGHHRLCESLGLDANWMKIRREIDIRHFGGNDKTPTVERELSRQALGELFRKISMRLSRNIFQ
jgi:hypothetical protein